MMEEVTNSSVLLEETDATTTEYATPTTMEYATPTTMDGFWTTESVFNSSSSEQLSPELQEDVYHPVFEVFNFLEIIMTSLELMVWIIAAIKMPRWRRNYRNQMLMQISVARFIKRVIFSFQCLQSDTNLSSQNPVNVALNSLQIYIDFVIVILIFFFIKHMYSSLIIVVVKVRQNNLYKVSICSWLVPMPISAVWTAIIICDALDSSVVYLLICCIFRWPLIFLGTSLYITILCRVLFDKIRKFARSLTIVTFLMCLNINFYLFSKDVITLWCFHSFETKLISYVSGLILNFLILSFYVILITLDYKHCNQTPKNSIPNYSLADTCCRISNIEHD